MEGLSEFATIRATLSEHAFAVAGLDERLSVAEKSLNACAESTPLRPGLVRFEEVLDAHRNIRSSSPDAVSRQPLHAGSAEVVMGRSVRQPRHAGSAEVGASQSRVPCQADCPTDRTASPIQSVRIARDCHTHRSVPIPIPSGLDLGTGRVRRDLGACSEPLIQTRQHGAAPMVTADEAAGTHNRRKTVKSFTSVPFSSSRIHILSAAIPPGYTGGMAVSEGAETSTKVRQGDTSPTRTHVASVITTCCPRRLDLSSSLTAPAYTKSIGKTYLKTPHAASQLVKPHLGL